MSSTETDTRPMHHQGLTCTVSALPEAQEMGGPAPACERQLLRSDVGPSRWTNEGKPVNGRLENAPPATPLRAGRPAVPPAHASQEKGHTMTTKTTPPARPSVAGRPAVARTGRAGNERHESRPCSCATGRSAALDRRAQRGQSGSPETDSGSEGAGAALRPATAGRPCRKTGTSTATTRSPAPDSDPSRPDLGE
jgi:hypothetical protein